ncbi:MAG: ATP-binding protein, partial [Lachnospiraceae bacterium]|nr:ATP-binding protein [Lachnospiraceae bacterium]
ASAKGLTYDVSVKPDLTINASPDAIRQLLTILLDNAMKYANRGGNVSLDLLVHKRSLILTVANSTQDTIDPADLAHVFDRFYRSDASRNSATGGHGIGLSIAKAIVSAHAGRITASTKSGHDFTVTVTLPL